MIKACKIDVAVLLIFSDRPEKFEKVFEQVKMTNPSKLYLYQDGPSRDGINDIVGMNKCREIALNIDWKCEVHTLFQKNKVGDSSQFIAQKWMFETEETGIVLQQDEVPSHSFFPFCKELLEKYKNDNRINIICGMNKVAVFEYTPYDYVFSTLGSVCGWASWKRVIDTWDENYRILDDEFNLKQLSESMELFTSSKEYINNCKQDRESGSTHYESILRTSMYLNHRLNIVAAKNMISKIGVEANTTRIPAFEIDIPLKHPPYVIDDVEFRNRICKKPCKNKKHVELDNSSKQIKAGAIMGYITIAINMIAGLIYTPWMVGIIGQGPYGLYTLSTSLISLVALDFGLSAAVTRFVSKYNVADDQKSVNNVLGIVSKLFLFIDAFICISLIIVFFFINIIYKGLTVDEIQNFKIIYIITSSFTVISFPFTTLNGILISYEKFVSQKVCDLFNRVFNVALMIIALSMGYGLYTLVTINAFSGLVSLILKMWVIKKQTPVKINFKFKSKKMLKEVLEFSVWSTIISIAQRFVFNIVPTILGSFSGSVSIAIFGVASTLEGYVFTFSTAINGMLLPKVSRIVAKNEDRQDILTLMIKVGRIQFTIIGLLTVGFISIGKEFIYLWMGKSFDMSYLCAVILIIPSLFEIPQHIANLTVIAVNKVRLQSYVYISTAFINIIMSIVLSRYFGELGASISICIAYLIRIIAMNVIYYKVLKINVFTFFMECHIKMCLAFFVPLILGICLHLFVSMNGWLTLLAKVLIITFIYFFSMWFFAWNKYEKTLFASIFRRIINIIK